MAIYTGKEAVGSEFVTGAVNASEWTRVEPILTPDQLKRRFLFGIPLAAALPNPVTGRREELNNEDLKDIIIRATSQVEFKTGVSVLPVEKQVKLPFDRNEYVSLGYVQLPDRPILAVKAFEVWTADNQSIYKVPLEWIDSGNFQRGQLNMIPLNVGFLNAAIGAVPSQSAGGSFYLSILGARPWIASYWCCTYITGFNEGHVPLPINELIGIVAAQDVLAQLQATNRIAGFSVGIDATSQSVNTPGPQVYQVRIEELQLKEKDAVNKVKAKFSMKWFSTNV